MVRNNRQFQQVLDAANRAANEHASQQERLEDAMRERYGISHSDVDCDALIDSLNYGGPRVTVSEADEAMAAAGAPKITST